MPPLQIRKRNAAHLFYEIKKIESDEAVSGVYSEASIMKTDSMQTRIKWSS